MARRWNLCMWPCARRELRSSKKITAYALGVHTSTTVIRTFAYFGSEQKERIANGYRTGRLRGSQSDRACTAGARGCSRITRLRPVVRAIPQRETISREVPLADRDHPRLWEQDRCHDPLLDQG